MMPTDYSVRRTPTILSRYEQAHVDLDLLTQASYNIQEEIYHDKRSYLQTDQPRRSYI